jgi:hypothetical protein
MFKHINPWLLDSKNKVKADQGYTVLEGSDPNKPSNPEFKPTNEVKSLWDSENYTGNQNVVLPQTTDYLKILQSSTQQYGLLNNEDLKSANTNASIKPTGPDFNDFLQASLMGINAVSEYDTKLKESDKFLKKSQDIFRGQPVYTNKKPQKIISSGGSTFDENGKPIYIKNLAEKMIRLSGKEPYTDIDIVYTGLRPGEKLYEEVLADTSKTLPTYHPKILIAQDPVFCYEKVQEFLLKLQSNTFDDKHALIDLFTELVPEFIQTPQE